MKVSRQVRRHNQRQELAALKAAFRSYKPLLDAAELIRAIREQAYQAGFDAAKAEHSNPLGDKLYEAGQALDNQPIPPDDRTDAGDTEGMADVSAASSQTDGEPSGIEGADSADPTVR